MFAALKVLGEFGGIMKRSQHIFCVTVMPKSDEVFRIDNSVALARHHFHKKEFTIGSAKNADLRIQNKSVGALHLRARLEGDQIYLENLDPKFQPLVSGRKIEVSSPLIYKPGEMIQIPGFEGVINIDLFQREIRVTEIKEEMLAEARTQVQKLKAESDEVLRAAIQERKQAQEITEAAQKDAYRIKTEAQKQYEEIIRGGFEASQKRAEEVGVQMITNAKNQVQTLLNEASETAKKVAQEGLSEKQNALKQKEMILKDIDDLKVTLKGFIDERQKQFAEFEQETQRKNDLDAIIRETETNLESTQKDLHSLVAEIEGKKLELEKWNQDLKVQLEALVACRDDEKKSRMEREREENLFEEFKVKNQKIQSEVESANKKLESLNAAVTALQEREREAIVAIEEKAEKELERLRNSERARLAQLVAYESKSIELRREYERKLTLERRKLQVDQLSSDIFNQITELKVDPSTQTFFKERIPAIVEKAIDHEARFREDAITTLKIGEGGSVKNKFKKVAWTSFVAASIAIIALSAYFAAEVYSGRVTVNRNVSSVK